MLIIDSEKKKKIINTCANKNTFFKGFLGILVYIATVYLRGAEEPSSNCHRLPHKCLTLQLAA